MSLIVCSNSTKNFILGENYIIRNPPTKDLLKLMGKYNNVIAIGGGSVIDTAKILSNTPIICYPTTASGATATSHSVYWDGINKMNCKRFIPKETRFNEKFIESLPEHILLHTKYDAISHCLDVIWSKNCYRLDILEVEKILKKLIDSKITPMEIIKLGHIAGSFIQKVPTTILHALSYPITGKYNIPHGKALGFLIPPLCKLFNYNLRIERSNNNLNLDLDFIIKEAQTYPKFFHTNKKINLKELKKLLKEETYK